MGYKKVDYSRGLGVKFPVCADITLDYVYDLIKRANNEDYSAAGRIYKLRKAIEKGAYGVPASAVIGSGDNGTITITCNEIDAALNGTAVKVIIPELDATPASKELDVSYTDGEIVISLSITDAGVPVNADNTATDIADALTALSYPKITAVASGEGTTAFTEEEETELSGGTQASVGIQKCIDSINAAYTSLFN